MQKSKIKNQNESGVALVLVLGLLIVVAAVALVVSVISITERGLTANERMQRQAFDVAEFGLETYINKLDRIVVKDTAFTKGSSGPNTEYWWGSHRDTVIAQKSFTSGTADVSFQPYPGYDYEIFGDHVFNMNVSGRAWRPGALRDVRKELEADVAVGPKARQERYP